MVDGNGENIGRRIEAIRAALRAAARRAGRDASSVRLLAATKTVSVDRVRTALAAGLRLFGENRLQEAMPKIEALASEPIEWHFIGRLQRRKVKQVVGRFALIHSVDSVELAEEINRRAEGAGLIQPVLLEVNVAGEASKGGFAPHTVAEILPALAAMPHLSVRGLMTIPPYTEDPEGSRSAFRSLRALSVELSRKGMAGMAFDELSMGMSNDFAVAVEEGATIVRIGTALFGARPQTE
ncbi:UPF0001 protein [Nitrospira sp.]|nr:UPF0001 protein [Nitrospira sp.]